MASDNEKAKEMMIKYERNLETRGGSRLVAMTRLHMERFWAHCIIFSGARGNLRFHLK